MSDLLLDLFLLIFPIVFLIGLIFLGRHFLIGYLGPKPGRQLFRQRRPILTAVVAAVALITLGFWLVDLAPLRSVLSVLDVMLLIATIAAILYVPVHLLRKQRLGKTIVRLPWSRWNTIWVAIGALNVLIAPTSAALAGQIQVLHLATFTLGGTLLLLGLSRFEVREAGLVALDSILLWSKVLSYQWEDGERCVLKLETKRASPWRTGYWVVPPDKRALISEVLDRNIGRR